MRWQGLGEVVLGPKGVQGWGGIHKTSCACLSMCMPLLVAASMLTVDGRARVGHQQQQQQQHLQRGLSSSKLLLKRLLKEAAAAVRVSGYSAEVRLSGILSAICCTEHSCQVTRKVKSFTELYMLPHPSVALSPSNYVQSTKSMRCYALV